MILVETWLPHEFTEFVRDELARRGIDPPADVVFVAEPSDLETCHSIWFGDWGVPVVEFADGEVSRLDGNTLFVRRLTDAHSTFNAAMAGAESC